MSIVASTVIYSITIEVLYHKYLSQYSAAIREEAFLFSSKRIGPLFGENENLTKFFLNFAEEKLGMAQIIVFRVQHYAIVFIQTFSTDININEIFRHK